MKENVLRYAREHSLRLTAWGLFGILVLSLIFACPPFNIDGRSFWCRSEAYWVGSIISIFFCALALQTHDQTQIMDRDDRNGFYISTWAYICLNVYACRWEIPFAVPVLFSVLLLTMLQRNVRKLIIISIAGALIVFLGAFFIAKSCWKTNLNEYEYSEKARQSLPVEIVDAKDNYIFTREFGLEKSITHLYLRSNETTEKGDTVFRFLAPNGDVWIEKK